MSKNLYQNYVEISNFCFKFFRDLFFAFFKRGIDQLFVAERHSEDIFRKTPRLKMSKCRNGHDNMLANYSVNYCFSLSFLHGLNIRYSKKGNINLIKIFKSEALFPSLII